MQREGLLQDLASSLEKLAHAFFSLREWEKAIQRARHWVSLDRLNENAQRTLMQIYAQAGQRSAALHQFEECSHWLQEELGQSPSEETIALYQKIQTGKIGKQGELLETTTLRPLVDPAQQPLIKTKLFIPRLRAGLVSRPHLIAMFMKIV